MKTTRITAGKVILTVVVLFMAILAACAPTPVDCSVARGDFESEYFSEDYITGVGITEIAGQCAIYVMTDTTEARPQALPLTEYKGVPLVTSEGGPANAQAINVSRQRPLVGGFSVGHKEVTAGTIGAFVVYPDGRTCILSNNHVLANSNKAQVGDPIVQPGVYDGGLYPRDLAARLDKFVVINMIGNAGWPVNFVDAAIACPVDGVEISHLVSGIGEVTSVSIGGVGMRVVKSGRTTGVTTGRLTATNTTVKVNYPLRQRAVFSEQYVFSDISEPGDSGSVIVTQDGHRAVALLFAGTDTETIGNPITIVFSALQVRLPDPVYRHRLWLSLVLSR